MKSKKLISLVIAGAMVGSIALPTISAYADQFNVISIGANLTQAQKQEMIQYFNAKQGTYEEVTIDNQQEQQELKGIVPESEIGTRTISCAYVQPTQSGGINVKTANLTYVTANMITNALTTAGIYNANVVAAAPFQVSGTGALTGIMESFEKATGQTISPQRKELANKELADTTNIANNSGVGQDKASAVVNQVKTDVVQNGENDQSQIANTINNVTNEYGVTLTPTQKQDLINLMQGISQQNYNKSEMVKSLDKIQDQLNKALDQDGQLKGAMNKLEVHWNEFTNWIEGIFSNAKKEAGIVNQTNNSSSVGKTAVTTGNSTNVEGTTTTAETPAEKDATLTNGNTNNSAINVVNSSETNTNTTSAKTNSSTNTTNNTANTDNTKTSNTANTTNTASNTANADNSSTSTSNTTTNQTAASSTTGQTSDQSSNKDSKDKVPPTGATIGIAPQNTTNNGTTQTTNN